ncbi:phage major head subunit gpT-like protein [Rhizobium subbaraonis]|uniref:Phage major head subunit gpT-like protein n=1 Tax=Rhizobium subbaraonis TaxID=908946 RepID=A0A285V2D4_9HYPH|nr:Mu-like prophage major head subunit gpT family protein [Rhizobium subbaraonis]SOC46651.1 phage major head subunit gpT-like protein [Rhizobium subbaraonis]
MIINSQNLAGLRVGFKTNFQQGLSEAPSLYARIATVVPSATKENKYGWLGKIPGMREWIGPRQVQNISEFDYSLPNKSYEQTIGVDRDDIEDDNLGIYSPLFKEMGAAVAAHPDTLIWPLLKNGFTTPCYDGQYFFDTDHPVENEDGTVTAVSNSGGGNGTPWFLLCTNRALKPLIFQERKKPQFVARDNPDDSNVFTNKEFQYGTDSRCAVGFGFWQFAYGSKQELTAANYEAARVAIMSFKGDRGRPLGLVPNLLVVPPALGGAARKIVQSVLVNGGESNPWANTAEILEVPWLA